MADPAVYNSIYESNKSLQSCVQNNLAREANEKLKKCPWDGKSFTHLPLLPNPDGCLCVVINEASFRCGASCTWTVPAGATRAQFQVWGPGGGSGGGNCCSASPYGHTGAYMTFQIDVTAGCQYTLCAGCAYNCCPYCCCQFNVAGGNSYVTGDKLCSICAASGIAGTYRHMTNIHAGFNCCRYQPQHAHVQGGCICGTGTYICVNGCNSCGSIAFAPDCCQYGCGCTTTGEPIYTIPSSSPWGHTNTSYVQFKHPPMIDICHRMNARLFNGGLMCAAANCGGSLLSAASANCMPGAGGFASFGSGTCRCGDTGRAGMVRVTWICG